MKKLLTLLLIGLILLVGCTSNQNDNSRNDTIRISNNTVDPSLVLDKSTMDIIIKRADLRDYWNEKDNSGKYILNKTVENSYNYSYFYINIRGLIRNMTEEELIASERFPIGVFNVEVKRYDTIEDAESIYAAYDEEMALGTKNYAILNLAGNEFAEGHIGNESTSCIDYIIMRRNNYILNTMATIKKCSEEGKEELRDYMITMDERITAN